MANHQGDYIWYELITTDATGAAAFYGAVIGWTAQAYPGGMADYQLFSTAHGPVAGFMSNEKCPEMRTGWLGYIAVDDVDAKAAEIVQAGGFVRMEAMDIPGVGRMAMVTDPQGAPFYIMRGASEGTSNSFDQAKTGHGNWNELTTSDQPGALAFDEAMFGWTKSRVVPMGPMGDYQLIAQNGQDIGGVMTRPPGGPPPSWCYYFGVPDIEAAAKAVVDAKGSILHGPVDVPGGARIIVASDPQGGIFGAVGPAKAA